MSRRLTLAAGLAAASLAAPAALAQQTPFTHVNRIFLTDVFNDTSGFGDNPLSVAFDGTDAFVGGFNNNPDSPDTVGVAKVTGLLGGAPAVAGLSDTILPTTLFLGLDALAHEPTTDSLIMIRAGSAQTPGLISRRQASDGALGAQGWTVESPFGLDPKTGAIDPRGDNGNPAVAFLSFGSGRRQALSLADGSEVFGPSGSDNPGGIVLGLDPTSGETDFGSAFRAVDFDTEGNIAVMEQDFVRYGERVDDNLWESLDGTADRLSSPVQFGPTPNNNFAGQGVVILEGLGPDGSDLLAFTKRQATLTRDLNGEVLDIDQTDVHIRNLDGSVTGLTQTNLVGNEDGVGEDWLNNTKNLAFGIDEATGSAVLLVVDFIERRLDVFATAAVNPPLVGDLNADGFVGAGDLDILLGVWNQNVEISSTPDLNDDGFVGAGDLDILLGNWNQGTPPTPAAGVVPEPATAALLGLGGLALWRRRR